jgi:hypothetical protein
MIETTWFDTPYARLYLTNGWALVAIFMLAGLMTSMLMIGWVMRDMRDRKKRRVSWWTLCLTARLDCRELLQRFKNKSRQILRWIIRSFRKKCGWGYQRGEFRNRSNYTSKTDIG